MDKNKITHALIMAAGRGNRMRPLTDSIPKSMVPYNGDTLIGNSLSELQNCVKEIHVTVGYKKAMLSEYLMTKGVDTIINTEGHGNAWWISNSVMQYVDEPVLVLTTDNITKIDINFLSDEYERLNFPSCLLVPVKPIPGIDGDYIYSENGKVTSIERNGKSNIYCSGIQVLNPKKIASLGISNDSFYGIWEKLISIKELRVSSLYPKIWFSIDTLDQLASAEIVGKKSGGS